MKLVFLLHSDNSKTNQYLRNLDKLGIDLEGFDLLLNEATGEEFLL